jgi:hypothetical protein
MGFARALPILQEFLALFRARRLPFWQNNFEFMNENKWRDESLAAAR